MKQKFYPLQAIGVLLLIFVLPACVKDNHGGRQIDQALKRCPILTIQSMNPQQQPGVVITQYDIHYNAAGNPVDMIQTKAAFRTEEYHFRYDRSDRLTDYIVAYAGSQGAITWHVYTYPDRNIIVDSQYAYTNLISDPKPDPRSYERRDIYTLDKEGRIIEIQHFGVINNTYTISYDSQGNAIWPGAEYDDKVNPYRTNPVWQFIYGDYSMNNPTHRPVQITAYNSFGLPRIYQWPSGYFSFPLFDGQVITDSEIELHINYGCDINPDAPGAVKQ